MATTAELLIFRPRIGRFQHVEHDLNFLIKLKPPTRALAHLVKRKDKKKMMEKLFISQLFSSTSSCSEFANVATWTLPVTCDARRPSFHMIQFFPPLRQCRLSDFNLSVVARHPPFEYPDFLFASKLAKLHLPAMTAASWLTLRRRSLINLINWFNKFTKIARNSCHQHWRWRHSIFVQVSGACVAIRFSQTFCHFSAWAIVSTIQSQSKRQRSFDFRSEKVQNWIVFLLSEWSAY